MPDVSSIVEQAFANYLRTSYDPHPSDDTLSDARHAFFAGAAFMHVFADGLITAANGDLVLIASTFSQVVEELRKHLGESMPNGAHVSFIDPSRTN